MNNSLLGVAKKKTQALSRQKEVFVIMENPFSNIIVFVYMLKKKTSIR